MTEQTLESIRPGVRELLKRPAIPIVVIRRLPGRASGRGERRTWPAIDAGQRLPVGIDRKLLTALSVLRLVDRSWSAPRRDRLDAHLPDSAAGRAGVTLPCSSRTRVDSRAPNPVDRNGIPPAVRRSPANAHDASYLLSLVDAIPAIIGPRGIPGRPQKRPPGAAWWTCAW